jgi:lysyl-tRNA synthetase class 2
MQERRAKVAGKKMPYRSDRDHAIAEARKIAQNLSEGEDSGNIVTVAGRMMAKRRQGKIGFADLQDQSGTIQLFFHKVTLGETAYEDFKSLDVGDIVQCTGTIMRTPRGEASVHVTSLLLLNKCLRPLPDKHNGLVDPEKRLAQRYLDMIANEGVRERFRTRSRIVSKMRRYLEEKGFEEVETPLLQPLYGGASARPFVSHHNEMDRDLYLRISPELYLKRLLVGGNERVFEIGRSLRNEGVSTRHNPEFTMVELYQAYSDFHDMMELTEDMIRNIAQEATGKTSFTFKNNTIDLAESFQQRRYADLIEDATGINIEHASVDDLRSYLEGIGKTPESGASWADLVDDIFSQSVEQTLIQPTFVTHFPAEMSPLAREDRNNPFYAERFELILAGMELANAYSEQNDPEVQLERLQELAKSAGEAVDEDYITALQYAMPPSGGMGMGIDRLTMLLTEQESIRETILFPARRS